MGSFGLLATNACKKPQMPQIVRIGSIVQKHTWTTWNRTNEADLTYLGMLDGSIACRHDVDKQNGSAGQKATDIIEFVGSEYDKQLRCSKKALLAATLSTSFARWDTHARVLQTLKQAGFLLNLFKQIRSAIFCARIVPRKFQNCFDFNKNANSFAAKSTQISRKNTQISAKVRKSGFLHWFLHCCGSWM